MAPQYANYRGRTTCDAHCSSARTTGSTLRRLAKGKAKAAGKYKGRRPSIDRTQVRQLRAELGHAAIAKKLGIARSSVYRLLPH